MARSTRKIKSFIRNSLTFRIYSIVLLVSVLLLHFNAGFTWKNKFNDGFARFWALEGLVDSNARENSQTVFEFEERLDVFLVNRTTQFLTDAFGHIIDYWRINLWWENLCGDFLAPLLGFSTRFPMRASTFVDIYMKFVRFISLDINIYTIGFI